ncbi:hypothetical protein C8Q77DRAFT_1152594 [Trametes polyzona]|nr:hypothetical protein C8Q77DRAFT_1152594 [Trametes polyzona]
MSTLVARQARTSGHMGAASESEASTSSGPTAAHSNSGAYNTSACSTTPAAAAIRPPHLNPPPDSSTCTSPSAPTQSYSPAPSLKRARSTSVAMDPDLPPAPKIDGEAMLEVFVHRTMKFSGAPLSDSPYGDGQRLACLGHKMLEAAYTDVLFNKRPMLKADELREKVDALQEDVEKWVEGYKWRDKVRHTSEVDLKAPEETRILFDSYVGAVFVGAGYKAVREWIGALVDPQANPHQAPQGLPSEPEYKRVKVESPSLGVGTGFGHSLPGYPSYPGQNYFQHSAQSFGQQPPQPFGQPPPPPPGNPPPPLPMHNPLAPAQPHSAFLPLFNQTAQQRRLEVQYPAQFSGPPHAGRWTVACLVNGIEKGIGTGPSKQLAKEEAARQAYHNMGWAPRTFQEFDLTSENTSGGRHLAVLDRGLCCQPRAY